MTPEYVPLSTDETAVRLCHRILINVLSDRNRQDLLREYDVAGCRIEDDPEIDGLALYVGSELVTRVSGEAVKLGLQLEAVNNAN